MLKEFIYKLLNAGKDFNIPTIGSITKLNIPAKIDFDSGQIHSPKIKINFNADANTDYSVVYEYANIQQVPLEEAEKLFLDFISEVNLALQYNKQASIFDIGTLVKKDNDEIVFNPFDNNVLDKEKAALKTVGFYAITNDSKKEIDTSRTGFIDETDEALFNQISDAYSKQSSIDIEERYEILPNELIDNSFEPLEEEHNTLKTNVVQESTGSTFEPLEEKHDTLKTNVVQKSTGSTFEPLEEEHSALNTQTIDANNNSWNSSNKMEFNDNDTKLNQTPIYNYQDHFDAQTDRNNPFEDEPEKSYLGTIILGIVLTLVVVILWVLLHIANYDFGKAIDNIKNMIGINPDATSMPILNNEITEDDNNIVVQETPIDTIVKRNEPSKPIDTITEKTNTETSKTEISEKPQLLVQTPETKIPETPKSKGKYYVLISGAIKTKEKGEEELKRVKRKGISAELVLNEKASKFKYRIVSKNFENRKDADALKEKVVKEIEPTAIVKTKKE